MKILSILAVSVLFVLMPCAAGAVEIEVSELDRAKSDERRDAFSDWMSSDEFEVFNEEQKKAGKFLIYTEGNGGREYRGIYGEVEPNGWFYNTAATEEMMIRSHKDYTSRGLKLMTLSKSRSDRYGVIWVTERSFAEVSAQLEKFGIGLGKISE